MGISPCPAGVLDRHISRWISMLLVAACGRDNTPRVPPKSKRNRHGIDVGLVPPCALVTLAVKLAMMDPAQRHRELIRYPAADSAWLREPNVMSLAGLAATHGARLTSNEAKMNFIA